MGYIVIENTPGYMPEGEPAEFDSMDEATAYAEDRAKELEDDGYTRVINETRLIELERSDTVAPDLGRVITIDQRTSDE